MVAKKIPNFKEEKMRSTPFKIFISLILLFAVSPVFAGQFLGGYGFLHSHTALSMPPGALDVSFYARAYADAFESGDETVFLYNGTSALTGTFGYTKNVEFAVTQVMYQDINALTRDKLGLTYQIPGNTYMRFKFGNYYLGNSEILRKMKWGIMPGLRFRTAKVHDIQFEPYYSFAIELETQLLLSYFQTPLYPDRNFSTHFNLGWVFHNDGMSEDLSSTQEVNFLISFLKSREKGFDYGAEIYGSFFFVRPRPTVLGREDWVYVTPMLRFKPLGNLKIILGLDVLVLGNEETTVKSRSNDALLSENYANYSTWRFTTRFAYNPSTTFFKVDKEEGVFSGRQKRTQLSTPSANSFVDRQSLFKWAIEERGGDVEAVELDLDQIREERRKAEEELEELKKKLEEKEAKR